MQGEDCEFDSRQLHQIKKMRIVLISDTHNCTPELPDGDVLVHAGDATMMGTKEEVNQFNDWLCTLRSKYKHILFVPGNHDFLFEQVAITWFTTLINQSIVIDGIKFWGSPYTLKLFNWAFMKSEVELAKVWSHIPDKIDVLITHGPPKGILDRTISGENVGSQSLLDRSRIVRPKVHVFGHIHEAYGSQYNRAVHYINASIVNEYYQNVNKPVVIDIGV